MNLCMLQALSPITPLQRRLAWCLVILTLPSLAILLTVKNGKTEYWMVILWTVFLVMGVLILVTPLLIARSARKEYRYVLRCQMQTSYAIEEDAISGEVNGSSWRTTWPNFVRTTESEQFVFCYLSKSSALIFKRQALSDDVVRFLREKIVQPDEPIDELYQGKIS
jgi:hypothetical protein